MKVSLLSIHAEGIHTNMLPMNPSGRKTNLIGSVNLAEGGSTHPTSPFPFHFFDPNHDDLKPRKEEAARTHVPHYPSDHHKKLVYSYLFAQEAGVDCGREAGGKLQSR